MCLALLLVDVAVENAELLSAVLLCDVLTGLRNMGLVLIVCFDRALHVWRQLAAHKVCAPVSRETKVQVEYNPLERDVVPDFVNDLDLEALFVFVVKASCGSFSVENRMLFLQPLSSGFRKEIHIFPLSKWTKEFCEEELAARRFFIDESLVEITVHERESTAA